MPVRAAATRRGRAQRPLNASEASGYITNDVDNLTHTLFGLTLSRTPLGRAGRGVTAALVIASNVPDIDIVTTLRGTAAYLQWHRGPTHGPLGVVVLGLLTAALVRGFQRIRIGGPRAPDDPEAPFGML